LDEEGYARAKCDGFSSLFSCVGLGKIRKKKKGKSHHEERGKRLRIAPGDGYMLASCKAVRVFETHKGEVDRREGEGGEGPQKDKEQTSPTTKSAGPSFSHLVA